MATIDNILTFIDEDPELSVRAFELGANLTNGSLSKAKAAGEISPENLEKVLEKYSIPLQEAGYYIVDFGPALSGKKAILTKEEKKVIEGLVLGDSPSSGDTAVSQLSRLLPMGDIKITVKDYIDKIEEHNGFLKYIIRNGLVDLKSSLGQGQQELMEQLQVQTTNIRQHVNTLLAKRVVKPPESLSKEGKGLGDKAKSKDGKGKIH